MPNPVPYYPDQNVGHVSAAQALGLTGVLTQHPPPEARPSTALEALLELCEVRAIQAQCIHERLLGLLTRLQGEHPTNGGVEPAAKPSGLIETIREALNTASAAQEQSLVAIRTLEALI